jgi:hypothetical protein
MTISKTLKLEIGKDIFLAKGEKLLTFKNKITGEIVYSTTKYVNQIIQGKEFIPVFKRPSTPKERRVNLISLEALERLRM